MLDRLPAEVLRRIQRLLNDLEADGRLTSTCKALRSAGMHPAPCLAFLSGFDFFNLTTPALDGPKLNDDENSKSARKLRSCFRAAAAALPAHPRLYNISRFLQLDEAVAAVASTAVFTAGGAAPCPDRPLVFFPDAVKPSTTARVLDIATASAADWASVLDSVSSPALFGRGAETVLDKTYRDARKVDRADFELGGALRDACAEIVKAATHALPPRNRRSDRKDDLHACTGTAHATSGWRSRRDCEFDVPVRAELYKINAYGPGGFFRPHRDTPRGATMFGSLVVCLPVAFTGGQLVVRHAGREVVHDWAERSGNKVGGTVLQWAAFFSDCEHEILPVVDGLRVTLTFNLHRVTEAEEDAANDVPAPSVDMPGSSVESFLKQLLSDPLFMPDGGELGFALAHEYSKAVGGGLHLKLADLKGEDYLLTSAVKSAGLEFEVAAIYEADWEDDGEEKQQGYGPYSIEPNGYNFGSSVRINCCGDGAVLLVGPNFAARCEWMGGQKRELYDILTRDANCEVLKDLVWVRRPKAFTIRASSFAAYGNEATLVDIYATAALIVTIPGKRMLQSVED